MLTNSILRSAINLYEANTLAAIRLAKAASVPAPISLSFNTSMLSKEVIKALSIRIPTGGRKEDTDSEFIYIFSLRACSKRDLQSLSEKFATARETQRISGSARSLCRLNGVHENDQILYIGRSYSPRERFRAHMSAEASGPYAIRFSSWVTTLDLTIDFHLFQFKELDDGSAQAVEDGLWDEFNPLLGERGAR
ncbi:hypothetical protein [Pseudomonas rhodesiae]|uniref:Uncharacterized protein n=1 Tax=Pseudomonas rhodesiae TaxID=76760 RepID=A0AAE8HH24_9PSED|nr:hypothetical protein [Pseudomonas rhodesiae]TWR49295.1 hypothetical protein FIV35_25595 [Pseudomonas rhodesiae]SDV15444.1 hypothetical protein SAMN04490209_4998 [Pseudomonas rhodesiae]